ncbi:UNVERIFIED_CONTAM: ATP-dependent helicase BRM [Sesamum radiatum]|uniref:ATP-dependent helicase BRM n=1 Tax=Sesamum radiatum TaxID=300843 RepID=A0AAW2KRN1_SESRA
MANNPITMTAQMQALQALALERNIDLSHPANANVIAQLIPLIQSRMFAQQKANGSSTGISASFANHVTSSQFENESSPHGNSSSEVSGQSGSSKARLTVSPSTLGVTSRAALFNSSGNISVHGVDSPLPPRQQNLLGNGMSPLPQGQSSGNFNQGVDSSFVTTTSGAVDEASQIQHAREKEDRTLPRELLQAIVPPPLDMQIQLVTAPPVIVSNDRLAGENVDGHAQHMHSSQKGSQVVKLVSGVNNLKEEGLGDNVPAALAVTQSTTSTTKELRVPPGKGEQQSLDVSAKCDQEPETGTQKSPVRNEVSLERGKAVAPQPSISDTMPLKNWNPASSISQPKDAGSSRKYHGPLFDFPIFTRKNDTLGPSMMNNNNLILAYDIKDLLSEEDGEIRKRKREEKIEKIDKILAVNLERKRIRPDLVIRLQIESKTLQLAECQARLREEIEQQQVEIMSMPDRPYRKFVRLCERQRQELNRQSQANLKATRDRQLKSILQWRKKLLEAHWAIRDARTARNRGVHKYHERMLREFSKRKDDGQYLHKLGSKITVAKNQQEFEEAANAAAAAARLQGLSEEEVRAAAACAREEVMIRNRFSEMNARKDSSSVNKYYNLAHAVSERVISQPSMLRAGTLREYQLVGLQWMLSLYNNKLNGILADEMGLGKTVQVMALIAYLMEFKGNYGPHLIIVPNAVLVNWKEVLAMKFNVLVTTYEFIMYDRSKLSKVDWKYIIIDEAQRMKDRESVLARDLDRYRCQRRLLLTGTPLQKSLIIEKCFMIGSSQPFQKEGPTHNAEDDWLETEKKVITIHRLHQILEPFMLRRRVEDVEGSLPPKVSIVLKCRMSAIQSAIYDWIKSTGTLRVDPEDEQRKVQKNALYQAKSYRTLNNRCMELRKACNHPLLNYPYFIDFSKDFLVGSCGKLWILDRILIKLQKTGHRVLLFSTMTKLLDIMEEYLQWRRLVFRRIDGMTSLEDRESAIVDFNSPDTDCFIFLLSIRAAGRGLNLQSADTVIIYDPDPNPKNEEQAVARAHRIGQTREVKVIYMEAVVDKISSHQKEDEIRSVGAVDSDDDLAGKDRYMGSIESLIRNNIQQYKIEMADEVINAGRFDQRTTHEERRLTLETLCA